MPKYLILTCVSLLIYCNIRAAESDSLKKQLISKGFNNVAIVVDNNDLLVTFENSIYRFEPAAIKEVMNLSLPFCIYKSRLIIVVQKNKLPVVAIEINLFDYQKAISDSLGMSFNYIKASYNCDEFWSKFKNASKSNSSSLKTDVVVGVDMLLILGIWSNPIMPQFNLGASFNTSLWQGMTITVQPVYEIYNEIVTVYPVLDVFRPGLITANQIIKLPANIFVSATIGTFLKYRYGFDLETKKFSSKGNWAVGLRCGYTGAWLFEDKYLDYWTLDEINVTMSGEYRFQSVDFTTRVTVGKFVYDKGVRIDFFRQFGEINIGFFVEKTTTTKNVGFNFSLPIFPSKYYKYPYIRVRPSENFSWEYVTPYIPITNAVIYQTGREIDNVFKNLNPGFIVKYLRIEN